MEIEKIRSENRGTYLCGDAVAMLSNQNYG